MQHVITISIDETLLKEVDEEIKHTTFSGRSQLISYLLHRHLHQRQLSKHKDLILYLTVLLGFALLTILITIW